MTRKVLIHHKTNQPTNQPTNRPFQIGWISLTPNFNGQKSNPLYKKSPQKNKNIYKEIKAQQKQNIKEQKKKKQQQKTKAFP